MQPFNLTIFTAACLLSGAAVAQQSGWSPAVAQAPLPPAAPAAISDQDWAVDERTQLHRTIIKSLTVDEKAGLAIENRFGDVNVSTWDRNEFRVEISVTASASDAARARKALDAVRIDEQKNDQFYVFHTVIDNEVDPRQTADKNINGTGTVTRSLSSSGSDGQMQASWRITRKESNNALRIDYKLSMPRANKLTVKNSFGNVSIPDFWAPLSVESKFGDVTGGTLHNPSTVIRASFGNVILREVQNGNVNMSFGDLDINRGNVLRVEQKYGKLNIGEANRVDARTSYGETLIGAIRQSGKFKTSFAKQFRVAKIGPGTDHIDVESTYSMVVLPMQSMPNCDFDVTVTNSAFNVPALPNLKMTTQPDRMTPAVANGFSSEPARTSRARQYVGRVGNGEGPRIRVVATYGDVKFNK